MRAKLVIAEKPSVAQSIAAALGVKGRNDGYIEGNGYIVSWCYRRSHGHRLAPWNAPCRSSCSLALWNC